MQSNRHGYFTVLAKVNIHSLLVFSRKIVSIVLPNECTSHSFVAANSKSHYEFIFKVATAPAVEV